MSKQKAKSLRPRRTHSEKQRLRRNTLRKALSLLILLLCWIPMLGGGVQPMWVIPAAICIAMNEDMYFCMAAGVIAGFGIDIACGSVLAANAIFMVCFCTFVCLLFEQILSRSFWHYLLLTAACTFLRSGCSFLLNAVLFQLAGRSLIWQEILLPSSIWTVLVAIPVYLLFLPCGKLLNKQVKPIERAVQTQ